MPNEGSFKNGTVIAVMGDADAWAKSLSSVFVELEVEQLDPDHPPVGFLTRYEFSDLTFIQAQTKGGAHKVIRSEKLIRQSSHNNFYIGFMLEGEATLSQSQHSAILQKGDIAILDSTQEYAIEVPKAVDALWVSVPRHRLEGRLNSLSKIMAQRIDGNEGVGHIASNLLRASLVEAPNLRTSEANRITNHLLDLLALSLEKHTHDQPANAATHYHVTTLKRIQNFIDEELDNEELSPQHIAKAHNISGRYLSKLFEREGISVARWIRIRRLERCRQDLENPQMAQRSISDIAYSHGFANISSFNRTFRSSFGQSPRSLRNKMEAK